MLFYRAGRLAARKNDVNFLFPPQPQDNINEALIDNTGGVSVNPNLWELSNALRPPYNMFDSATVPGTLHFISTPNLPMQPNHHDLAPRQRGITFGEYNNILSTITLNRLNRQQVNAIRMQQAQLNQRAM